MTVANHIVRAGNEKLTIERKYENCYNHVQVHIVQVFVYNPFVQTLHICTTMLDRGVAQLEGQNIKNIY